MSLRLTTLIIVALLFVGTTQAQAQQDGTSSEGVVEARKFVLKDEDGTVRAEIGFQRGGPSIDLLNSDGSVGATLNLEESGRGLVILGPNGQEQIAMGKASGQPNYYLTIKSSDGRQLFSVPGSAATTQPPSQNNSSWLIAAAIVVAGISVGAGVYLGGIRRPKLATKSGPE